MKEVLKQSLKAFCYFLLMFIFQVIVSFIMTFGYSVFIGIEMGMRGETTIDQIAVQESVMRFINENMVWVVIISGLLTLAALWIFFVIRKKKLTKEAGISLLTMKNQMLLVALGIGLGFIINFGLQLLPIPEKMVDSYIQSSQGLFSAPFLLMILSNVIIAPLVEEIIFRGLILSRLRKVMPVWTAVIISSIAFAIMHGQLLWIAYTFLLGIVFSLMVLKTGSTLSSIIVHMIFNLFGVLLSVLSIHLVLPVIWLLMILGVILTVFSYLVLGREVKLKGAK